MESTTSTRPFVTDLLLFALAIGSGVSTAMSIHDHLLLFWSQLLLMDTMSFYNMYHTNKPTVSRPSSTHVNPCFNLVGVDVFSNKCYCMESITTARPILTVLLLPQLASGSAVFIAMPIRRLFVTVLVTVLTRTIVFVTHLEE